MDNLLRLLAAAFGAATGAGLWWAARTDPPAGWRRAVAAAGRGRWRRAAVAAAGGGAVWWAVGWPAAGVLAAAAVTFLPRLLGRDRAHAARTARIEAVASWAEMLRDTLSAAAGLEQALVATAGTAPAPIRRDVGELAAALRRGDRLTDALPALAAALDDQVADLVVAALLLAVRHQARDLAALLGALAASAREQAGMRLRVSAARARIRTSVRVVVATTVALGAVLVTADAGYLTPYRSAPGQVVLLAVGALFALGFGMLARTSRIPEPRRILAPPTTPGRLR